MTLGRCHAARLGLSIVGAAHRSDLDLVKNENIGYSERLDRVQMESDIICTHWTKNST